MLDTNGLSFDLLLETLAEKLAAKLTQEPSRLYPRLMTIEQAAVYLGQARQTIQHLARTGNIPSVLVASRILIDRIDLDRWIEEHKRGWV